MDFNKPSISKNIGNFLLDNLKTLKEKESLENVIAGKPVLKGDVLILLRSLLQAMTIPDNLGGKEIKVNITADESDEDEAKKVSSSPLDPSDEKKEDNNQDNPNDLEEYPRLAQSMAKWTLIESKNKKVNKTQSQNSSSKSSQQLTGDELLHKFENTCYFYKLGKCKFAKECKKTIQNSAKSSSIKE